MLHWLTCADYFTKLLEDNLRAIVKPQYVDQVQKAVVSKAKNETEKTVGYILGDRHEKSGMDNLEHIMDVLGKQARDIF